VDRVVFLRSFFGPFKELVDSKGVEVKKEDVLKERVLGQDTATGLDVVVRTGRFGPYVQLGRLEDMPEVKSAAKSAKGKKPKTVKREKPKSASIPKDRSKDEITFEEAMALLSFPKELGEKEDEAVTVSLGRFGPYIRWGKITVALPKDLEPADVTFEQAEKLIAEAKDRKKREAEPLKVLGKDPNTGGEIVVKDGRYGPYVTDGKTNASVPKRMMPEDIDLVTAAELLDKKRSRGPGKGGWRKKK